MTPAEPTFAEAVLEGEDPRVLQALYRDVLYRILGGSHELAFDVFVAQELTVDLWRVRRIGSKAVAEQRVERLQNRHEQMAAEWSEVEHRTKARKQVLASVQSLLDLYNAISPRAVKAPVGNPLSLVR